MERLSRPFQQGPEKKGWPLAMKATGIVRRIDDLGRVVIPKEIRKTLRIREGEPLEIFTDREGEVILKKYSPVGEMGTLSRQYSESLAQTLGCTVCITDRDQVIAAAGVGKKALEEQNITPGTEGVIQKREQLLAERGSRKYQTVVSEDLGYSEEIISPIISAGDAIGSVILLQKEEQKHFGPAEKKVAESAAGFLGKQMEQ